MLKTSEIIDAELARRGSSLAEWAAERGLTAFRLTAIIEGLATPPRGLILELSEAVGVSERTLEKMRAA